MQKPIEVFKIPYVAISTSYRNPLPFGLEGFAGMNSSWIGIVI